MKTIKFTIKGNQENPNGNPIPYLRTTQASQWTDKAVRYQEWKGYVVGAYIKALEKIEKKERQAFEKYTDLTKLKPIKNTGEKIHMQLQITWMNKAHADCDNVFKGIADALFTNDKFLVGEFDYEYGDKGVAGQVVVTITFL